jgi:glucose/arabinose dehydrogenase
MRRLALLLGTVVLVAGCGGEADTGPFKTSSRGPDPTVASPAQPSQTPSGSSSPTGTEATGRPRVVGTVAARLATPWGIAFLPDDSALVTERDSGRVLHIAHGRVTQVGDVDETSAQGESGLLGIAVSPSYAKNKAVFAYVTTDRDNRVVRMTFDGRRLSTPKPILTGIPNGFIHDGGRLQFAPDGNLFVSTGETGNGSLAQDPDSLGGKILRVTERGKPAPGNPDPGSPIWTIGHRNVQGLAFDDRGNLWASEFGDNTFDELNLIQKGNNYGWPEVEGKGGEDQGFVDPVQQWSTDDASPSGLAVIGDTVFVANLRGEVVRAIPASSPAESAEYFTGDFGRIRTVLEGPEESLWFVTNNTDGRGDPTEGDDRIVSVPLA